MKELHQLHTVIIGASMAAETLAAQIQNKKIFGTVAGFISESNDYPSQIRGIPVLGSIHSIEKCITKKMNKAIIAIEDPDKHSIQEIYFKLKAAKIRDIRILPDISRLRDAEAHLIQAREIRMEDLLGREPVKFCLKESLSYLRGKRVLITGAGGSIGRELCRQLLYGGAKRLYLFDHSENNVYEIDRDLRLLQDEGVGEKTVIVPIIGELQDKDYLQFLLNRLKADVIFHTAAYKHVPLMEENPVEVVKNNIFGTHFLAEAAALAGVSRLVLISTDKAVDPSCIYGVTKLIGEQIVLSASKSENNQFMVVRFGNVLGSRGSIVPLFQKQIEKGGPVTLTHPNVDRFFMTIPEASSLVLKAAGTGGNGNLYILDMGDPIKIIDLAKQMIEVYGFIPEKDIKIETIGLRAGEKLHENLWEMKQQVETTQSVKINRLIDPVIKEIDIEKLLSDLRPTCFLDKEKASLYRNRIYLKERLAQFFPSISSKDGEPEY